MISIRTISHFLAIVLLCHAIEKGEYVIELNQNTFKQLVVERGPWDYFFG